MSCNHNDSAATIDRGRIFAQTVTFTGAPDLTGNTFESQLRKSPDPASDLIATFTVDVTDAATGVLVLRLTDTQTGALTDDGGWYDLLRTTSAAPTSMFDRPLRAEIRDMPTT